MIPRSVLAGQGGVLDAVGATRAMTSVLGIMLFLTVLAGALGLAALGVSERLDRRLANRITVQLVDGNPAARDRAAAAALAALRARPDVVRAAPVGQEELRRLLRPWLGGETAADALPIPAMIDADLADGAALAGVRAAVLAAAPDARVDAQAAWMAPVARVMDLSVALAAAMVALTGAATLAVVALSVRAGLEAHRATIEVMHMLGSTDLQVARLFQRRAGLDALTGGGLGGLAGLAMAWAGGTQLSETGSELLGDGALSAGDWFLLACLPFLFAGLAALAARRAVMADLRRTL